VVQGFQHPQVVTLQHSLVDHHLGLLRAVRTQPAEFRRHVKVLSTLLAAEATRILPLTPCSVTTPLEETTCGRLTTRIAVVPILRAGLGMVEPLQEMIPEAEVWHLGLYRDEETAQPVHYYDKLPEANPPEIAMIVDPMLATGGSASLAVAAVKRWGVSRILVLSVISTPEGIQRLVEEHPQIEIFTCAVDRGLNARKYIVPGLGDAGDRIFNT
jgi:uracil phosphoribosyltransferase